MIEQHQRISYEEYRALPDDGNRYEVIQGKLLKSGVPFVIHQSVLGNLVFSLDSYLHMDDRGELFLGPVEIYLSGEDFVQPDLVFVVNPRMEIVREENIVGAPDLVVEILSPSTVKVDRVLKMNTYARHHVPHYWIVDPAAQTLEAFEWENGSYRLIAAHAEAEEFQPSLFPGLTIHLAELWK